MVVRSVACIFFFFLFSIPVFAQKNYPRGYFRHPLNIPMELVANFGEIRTNHWHMGLDIRTQQRENLPVFAAADGYIARISIDATGFGRAIYINHPNGLTTLYAHMNNFEPELHKWVIEQQYKQNSWAIKLNLPSNLFPVKKGDLIGYSGNTGGSQGPHVHFEIRDTRTDNCLNPLLFGFPIPDAVAPSVSRLVMYDRNRSTYQQTPQNLPLKKTGTTYSPAASNTIIVGSNRVSFAIGAVDRFSNSANPNGIYSAKIFLDEELHSGFELDDIDYDETRYINAQVDYRYKTLSKVSVQHVSRMPGDTSDLYIGDEALYLPDTELHYVRIEVEDANGNTSQIKFAIKYNPALAKPNTNTNAEKFLPQNINVFERESFELFTTELTMYDTVNVTYSVNNAMTGDAVSPIYNFIGSSIPSHDSVTVRIKPAKEIPVDQRDRIVIKSISGSRTVTQKGEWQNGWISAKFRQFGTYQAFIDDTPPTINNITTNLSGASRIVFQPTDNFKTIKSFRAEVNGQWLLFTNDKGYSHIYTFDKYFPRGESELKVRVEDVAGNVTTKMFKVTR